MTKSAKAKAAKPKKTRRPTRIDSGAQPGVHPGAPAAGAPPQGAEAGGTAADLPDRDLPDRGGTQKMAMPDTAQDLARDLALLEQGRMQWLLGDWQGLAALPLARLQGHPDRGRLALLVAAAHAQTGRLAEARAFLRQARAWGCDAGLMRRVMVSGLRNTLGQAALALGETDRAEAHVAAAIALGAPGSDTALLARARMARHRAIAQAGPDGEARPALPPPEPDAETRANPLFDPRAFAAWRESGAGAPDFLYLDVKSLPRSGLHYMRNTLRGILQQGFSFCEWYNEPGCCKRMPCALTAYRSIGHGAARPLVRMVKSHDFDFRDPAFPTGGAIRRIVLIRDPLYILSSWWALHQLYANRDLLKAHGLNVAKAGYQHEAPVLAAAYDILDAEAPPPPIGETERWLSERKAYILGFVAKWGGAGGDAGAPMIVPYAGVDGAVVDLLTGLDPALPAETRARLADHVRGRRASFTPRSDPFAAPTERLSAWLRDNAGLFRDTAAAILREDRTGLLEACSDGA
ncbi:MAG: hypothetical protein ACK4OP_00995 [Gemmobacter sp.]